MKMKFVENPNFPQSDVGLAAVSRTYPEIPEALRRLGIKTVEVGPDARLDASVSNHADMLCHHLGGRKIVCARGNPNLAKTLMQYGFDVIESNICIHRPYPADVALNALRVGEKLIAGRAGLDETIARYCGNHGIQMIPVRQGYAKCSAAAVDPKSVLTADEGIARAGIRAGLCVLKIRPGFIRLDGCDYGFIGGTCGMIGKRTMAFTGKIESHPDGGEIKRFLEQRGIRIIALLDSPLVDVGGILPLKERETGS